MNDDEPEKPSDIWLMQRVSEGDEKAFRLIVEDNIGGMMRYAINITGQFDVAEDMVQQAFTQAWKAANRWKPSAKLSTWLYTILRRECLQYLRKHKPDIRLIDINDVKDLMDQNVLSDQEMEIAEDKKTFDVAMQKLPERQRTALFLRFVEGLNQQEAAQIMEISSKALESLVSRGKDQLKRLMVKCDE